MMVIRQVTEAKETEEADKKTSAIDVEITAEKSIYLVSDATGWTAEQFINATLGQFEDFLVNRSVVLSLLINASNVVPLRDKDPGTINQETQKEKRCTTSVIEDRYKTLKRPDNLSAPLRTGRCFKRILASLHLRHFCVRSLQLNRAHFSGLSAIIPTKLTKEMLYYSQSSAPHRLDLIMFFFQSNNIVKEKSVSVILLAGGQGKRMKVSFLSQSFKLYPQVLLFVLLSSFSVESHFCHHLYRLIRIDEPAKAVYTMSGSAN